MQPPHTHGSLLSPYSCCDLSFMAKEKHRSVRVKLAACDESKARGGTRVTRVDTQHQRGSTRAQRLWHYVRGSCGRVGAEPSAKHGCCSGLTREGHENGCGASFGATLSTRASFLKHANYIWRHNNYRHPTLTTWKSSCKLNFCNNSRSHTP